MVEGHRISLFRKALLGCAVVAVGLCLHGIPQEPDVDSASYRRMAEGRMSEVVRPYANRVLHPLAVSGIKNVLQSVSADPETLAFCLVTVAALAVALVALAELTPELSVFAFAALVACPTLCLYCVNIYIQDLFALALTALLFWAVSARRFAASLLLLFLLQMTRESTVVIAVALVIAAAFGRRWVWALGACLAWAAGNLAVATISRDALPNIHAMSGGVYLLTKVVANGAENLLGVTVWSDTYARQLPHFYPTPPAWQMAVPAWLPLGGVRSVGIFSVDAWKPLELVVLLGSAFGLLPVTLLKRNLGSLCQQQRGAARAGCLAGYLRKWRAGLVGLVKSWRSQTLGVQVAVLAGGVFLLLSPFAGRTVERQIGYAWPLFWLTLPLVMRAAGGGLLADWLARPVFWLVHLACMWCPVLLVKTSLPRGAVCLLGVSAVVACQCWAWRSVKSEL